VIEPNDWHCTSAQLCELLAVSHKQLSRWHERGMPKTGRGTWDLRTCVQWLLTHLGEGDAGDEQGLALMGARQGLAEAQHRKLQIEIERLEGRIYDADVVHAAMDALAVIVTSAHNALPGRAPDLVGKPVEVVEHELEEECRAIGQAIADSISAFRLAKGSGLDAMAPAAAPA